MINKPVIGVAALVITVAAAGLYYVRSRTAPMPRYEAAEVPAGAGLDANSEATIDHPLPTAPDSAAPAAPLPALTDSDTPILQALGQLAGGSAVKDYLKPDNVIRHLVVTIDNLPRQKVAVDKRPTQALSGSFLANGDELHATLDAQNFERYKPLVAVLKKLDMHQLSNLYIRYYPLFQQSYQDLGYPNGYFNDRLVQVIDVLLASPQPAGPIELVRPNVMYVFADPALEARPAGQKLLIRMGADNATAIKAKLTEFRAAITAAPLKH